MPMAEGHGPGVGNQRRALRLALVANAAFLGIEVLGGLAFHSLALLADAAHMLSDVVALVAALIAQQLMQRPATARHSYGLRRSEILAAQLNGLSLVAVSGWVLYEALRRIGQPVEVVGGGLLAVAVAGLAVNVASAVVLRRAQGESLNMRGAFLHMAVDAAGSVGAIIAGVAALVWGANWVDPAASLLIVALVVWSAWGLLRDTTAVLLEATPRDIEPVDVEAALADDAEVEAVHHLHVWNVASDMSALSAHVVLSGEPSLHDAQASGDRLKSILASRFGIAHATLELECHVCDPSGNGDVPCV